MDLGYLKGGAVHVTDLVVTLCSISQRGNVLDLLGPWWSLIAGVHSIRTDRN